MTSVDLLAPTPDMRSVSIPGGLVFTLDRGVAKDVPLIFLPHFEALGFKALQAELPRGESAASHVAPLTVSASDPEAERLARKAAREAEKAAKKNKAPEATGDTVFVPPAAEGSDPVKTDELDKALG